MDSSQTTSASSTNMKGGPTQNMSKMTEKKGESSGTTATGPTTTDPNQNRSSGQTTGGTENLPVFKRSSGGQEGMGPSSFLPSLLDDPFLGYFQHDVPFLFGPKLAGPSLFASGGGGGGGGGGTLSNLPTSATGTGTMPAETIAIQENHRLPTELLSTPDEFIVRCDVPGVDADHVGVEYGERNELNIIVHRPRHKIEDKSAHERGMHYIRTERARGGVQRLIKFPLHANLEETKVKLCCGILEIRVPRKVPSTSSGTGTTTDSSASTNLPSAPGRKRVTVS